MIAGARLARASLLATVALLAPRVVRAQGEGARVLPELKIDAIDPRAARRVTLEAGLGVNVPLGYLARLEVVGAAGRMLRDSASVASGRVDVLGRFLLDPFRDASAGLSVGGGVSVRAADGARTRELLVVVLDLELPHRGRGGLVTAVQAGLGGGARIGIALRPYTRGAR